MHHFQVKKGELYAEGVPLSKLAKTYGTPLYVYSATTITDHFDRLTAVLSQLPWWGALIAFAGAIGSVQGISRYPWNACAGGKMK